MLSNLASPAAVVAAATFLIAAIAKLRSPRSARLAVTSFGLPAVISRLLAPIELFTAGALLVNPRAGAVLALALLTSFTAIVVRSLRRGVTVRCGCFGASDDRPIGTDTVVRNLFLMILVALCLFSTRLQDPTLPALVVVGSAAITAALVVALVRLGHDVGGVFRQNLSQPGRPQ